MVHKNIVLHPPDEKIEQGTFVKTPAHLYNCVMHTLWSWLAEEHFVQSSTQSTRTHTQKKSHPFLEPTSEDDADTSQTHQPGLRFPLWRIGFKRTTYLFWMINSYITLVSRLLGGDRQSA